MLQGLGRIPRLFLAAVCGLGVFMPHHAPAGEFQHILFRAIRSGDTELLKSTLRQGAPVNVRAADGTTPLMLAALHGSAETVQLLLQSGADPNGANAKGVTALLWGAGDTNKVRLLLKHGAKVNVRSELGNTPLICAAAFPGNTSTVEMLLAHGADLYAANERGVSAMARAVLAGDAATVKLLFGKGYDGRDRGKLAESTDRSLLHIAADEGHLEVVELLLEHGADVNQRDANFSGHALDLALLSQNPEMARRLIERGAELTLPTSAGRVPPFVLAAYTETGDTSIARLMLQRGVDPSAANQYGETALTWARRRGHQELIDLLVKAGVPEHPEKEPKIPNRRLNLHAGNEQQVIRDAVTKSISLLQHCSDVFLSKRGTCVSCHHQNLPAVAIGWSRDRGIQVDEQSIRLIVRRQARVWREGIDRAYQMDRPVPVAPRFLGWGLWGLAALGYPADDVTDAYVWYLAAIQHPDGHWASGSMRPPMGDREIFSTAIAMRSLQLYSLEGRRHEIDQRVALAAKWLTKAEPRYHQELVYKLLGLGWAGSSGDEMSHLVQELLGQQREDGGWSQLPNLKSDAWATGQSLVALHVVGGIPTSHPAYQRGIGFLLQTQFDDGAWFVKSRTWPFQAPFDSEFPFGRDQWISAGATAWATMALVLAVEPRGEMVVASGSPSDRIEDASSEGAANTIEAPETTEDGQEIPVPTDVDFVRHIKPILERSCVACHSGDMPESGFRVTSRESILRGGESGQPGMVVGQSPHSHVFQFAAGQEADLEMPPLEEREKYPGLNLAELIMLRAWIDDGAPWPEGVELEKPAY